MDSFLGSIRIVSVDTHAIRRVNNILSLKLVLIQHLSSAVGAENKLPEMPVFGQLHHFTLPLLDRYMMVLNNFAHVIERSLIQSYLIGVDVHGVDDLVDGQNGQ